MKFMDPSAPKTKTKPFWIYPLHIVEIKPELDCAHPHAIGYGLTRHFLNMHISVTDHLNKVYSSTKFDKPRHLPFSFQQYIQYKSNRLVSQAYSITISHMVPILYMANKATLAMEELQILT